MTVAIWPRRKIEARKMIRGCIRVAIAANDEFFCPLEV